MTADGNFRPRAEATPARVTSAGRPPWEMPPPGSPAPPGASQPARPAARTWWILPFCGGALAVIVVAATVIVIQHATRTARAAGPAHPATASAVPMPAEMFPGALFGKLSADLQAGNEAGFLGLASPAARPAIKTWWDNLNAIGFTTGAVVPTAGSDTVRIDGHGNGTTIVLAGAHSPLDPSYQGKPGIPLERYRIGLHFASPTATGQITSWQPLDSDPWDGKSGLYVRTSTNVVVAGLPGDSGVVNETVPLAQAAAAYDIGLVRQANPDDLLQEGFVVFVSGNAAVRDGWFAADPQPKGWPLVRGQQDVRRLQVAVHQAAGVHRLQRLGQPGRQPPDGGPGQRPARADRLVQQRAGDVAGGQPRRVVLPPGVDHLRGVHAVDRAGRGHLPREPAHEVRVGGDLGMADLHRHRPPRRGVAEEHPAHPARAEPGPQPELPGHPRVARPQRLHHGLVFVSAATA